MFKLVLSAFLCFGVGTSCISQEVPKEVELPFGLTVDPAFLYLGCGNLHLLLRDYPLALEDFRRASVCAEQCDKEQAEIAESLILFGQAVAYDNLNLKDKAEHCIASLILIINSIEDAVEEEADPEEDTEFREELENEFHQMMHRLALLAPSVDIRESLISIIDAEWNN